MFLKSDIYPVFSLSYGESIHRVALWLIAFARLQIIFVPMIRANDFSFCGTLPNPKSAIGVRAFVTYGKISVSQATQANHMAVHFNGAHRVELLRF